MNYREAFNRLELSGMVVMVGINKDCPVEILFWDNGLSQWNHFCGIDKNENIDKDAENDILELYSDNKKDNSKSVLTRFEFHYSTINPPRRLINSIKWLIRSLGISKSGANWYFSNTLTEITEFEVPTKSGSIVLIRLIHSPN